MNDAETTQRWQRVKGLLERALEIEDSTARGAFLATECGSDEALRAEVESLLEHESSALLTPPNRDALVQRVSNEPSRLGAYRILRRIGRGGMGSVYLGVRADGQFKKRVAIKLIRRGMDTDDVLRRFERERQVLANLDHRGIARLIDGGRTDDGLPYIVMEFVEGERLDDWANRNRLAVQERVELVREVCAAVHEAHRSLIVHRDLKPSNILVNADGQPKLLDFGIAKLLDASQEDATVNLTETPLRLLTPAFASPEQVSGGAITTAADIYALGAILYELLTGRPPLDTRSLSPVALERCLTTQEPLPPSRAALELDEETVKASGRGTSARSLSRSLAGDLDTVVQKALRKDPRRRYSSAAELRSDLDHVLRGLPIAARPDTWGYRVHKFVRRHRASVAVVSLAAIGLVSSLLMAVRGHHQARDAQRDLAAQLQADRQRAEELERLSNELAERSREAEEARSVAETRLAEIDVVNAELRAAGESAENRFREGHTFANAVLFQAYPHILDLPGSLEAVRILTESGSRYLEFLHQDGIEDHQLARSVVLAYQRLAGAHFSDTRDDLNDPDLARELLGKAREVGEELLAESPDELATQYALGTVLYSQGRLLMTLGERQDAIACYEYAAEVCGRGEAGPSNLSGRDYMRALALTQIADTHRTEGELEQALEAIDEADTLLSQLQLPRATTNSERAELARLRAWICKAQDDDPGEREAWERAVELLGAPAPGAPVPPNVQGQRWVMTTNLVECLVSQGSLDEARETVERILDEVRAALDAQPESVILRGRLVRVLGGALGVASARRDWPVLRELATEQLEQIDALRAREPDRHYLIVDRATALLYIARAAVGEGELIEAEELASEAVRVLAGESERDPDNVLMVEAAARADREIAKVYEAFGSRPQETPAFRVQWLDKALEALHSAESRLAALPSLAPSQANALERVRRDLDRCRAARDAAATESPSGE